MDTSNMNDTIREIPIGHVLLVIAALAWVAGCSNSTSAEPAIPNGANLTSWVDNGADGRYVLNVIKGDVPAFAQAGTRALVMTDSNCAPDAQNLNHCHNLIRFANGDRIEVINNHRMAQHRCLRPGETVEVKAMEGPWIELQTQS